MIRKLSESDVEAYLVNAVTLMGGMVRKIKFLGHNGAPDRCIMFPEFVHTPAGKLRMPEALIWVEVKAPGGKAKFPSSAHERAQEREHERLRKCRQRVEIVDTYAGVDFLLYSLIAEQTC